MNTDTVSIYISVVGVINVLLMFFKVVFLTVSIKS